MNVKTILIIMLALVLLAGTASAAVTQVAIGSPQGARNTIIVPVTVSGASNLGAMDLQVNYDPAVLKLAGAQMGSMSSNGVAEANEPQAGTVLISFVDTQGITGSGDIILITFDVVGSTGASSPLALQARAYDLDLKDIPVTTQDGSVIVGSAKSGIELLVIISALGFAFIYYGRKQS